MGQDTSRGTHGQTEPHVSPMFETLEQRILLSAVGDIQGTKWHDADNDGVQDPGEPGIAGVTVFVDLNEDGLHNDGEPFDITDAEGNYVIGGLAYGTYRIAEMLDEGWEQTYPGTPNYHTVTIDSTSEPLTTVTLDFEELAHSGDDIEIGTYEMDGYLIETTASTSYNTHFRIAGTGGGIYYTGSAALRAVWTPVTIILSRPDGAVFNLESIDLTKFWDAPQPPYATVAFTGFFADGSTVSQSFIVDHFGMQTYQFTGFEDVARVEWDDTSFDESHQFDNLVMTHSGGLPGSYLFDFEELAHSGDDIEIEEYQAEGFTIDTTVNDSNGGHFNIYGSQGGIRYTGTAALESKWSPVTIILTRDTGSPFNLDSIGLSRWWNSQVLMPVTVQFTGFFADGSTVNQSFYVDHFGIRNYDFLGFENVVRVEWDHTGFDDFHQFDNVRITNPASDAIVDGIDFGNRVTPTATGAPNADEGSPYTLTFSGDVSTVTGWNVDWGDGNSDAYAGDATSATHTYPDGFAYYPLNVTYTDAWGTHDVNVFGLTAGDLDPSFGGDGMVITNMGWTYDQVQAVVIQPDGKIIAAGGGRNSRLTIARYLPNGELDRTFGDNGSVNFSEEKISYGYSLILLPDGSILAASENLLLEQWELGVTKLNSDGSTDLSFGVDGWAGLHVGQGSYANEHMEVLGDGRIIVAASTWYSTSYDLTMLCFNADGTLDTTFGDSGLVRTDITGADHDRVTDITVQPDGKILVSGFVDPVDNSADEALLLRYMPDGSLDTTFGDGGIVHILPGTPNFPLGSYLNELIVLDDGRILGTGTWGQSDGALIRFNEDGTLDDTFGQGGILLMPEELELRGLTGMVFDDAGRILAGGFSGSFGQTFLLRFHADGTLDETFANGGMTDSPGGRFSVLAFDGQNRIVVGGRYGVSNFNEDFFVARFVNDSQSLLLVNNVAPTGTLTAGAAVDPGQDGQVMFTGVTDPSAADAAAGFLYSYDFDGDWIYEIVDSTNPIGTIPGAYTMGVTSLTVNAMVKDKDGGGSKYITTFTVNSVDEGVVEGYVFNDIDGNGAWDAGEPAVAGATVWLQQNNATLEWFETTDSSGYYSFTELGRQSFTVTILGQQGWETTSPTNPFAWGNNVFLPDRRDHVYDSTRDLFYITTDLGTIERYDVHSRQFLSPLYVGNELRGLDITPDGKFLYVAEVITSDTEGFVYKIDLTTNEVATLSYTRDFGESGARDIAIGSGGKALFTTIYAGSGWTPLREIDLATDTISIRTAPYGEVRGGTTISRTPDGSKLILAEVNSTAGNIHIYDAVSDSFIGSTGMSGFVDVTSLNHDASLMAVTVNAGMRVLDADFNVVMTFGGYAFAFHPTANLFYHFTSDDKVAIYDTETWEIVHYMELAIPNMGTAQPFDDGVMTFSDDGTKVCISVDGGVSIYDGSGSYNISLANGEVVSDVDFGASQRQPAVIRGSVFNDLDGDGLREYGEPILEGWRVYFDLDSDGRFDGFEPWGFTDWIGEYEFTVPVTQVGDVRLDLHSGWLETLQRDYSQIIPAEGQILEDFNFAATLDQAGQVSGMKWNDLNENGLLDAGEPGLENWLIYTDLDDDGFHDPNEPATLTHADGSYLLAGLVRDQWHTIRAATPSGWMRTSPGASFTVIETATVAGSAFDAPIDGIADGLNTETWLISRNDSKSPKHSREDRAFVEIDLASFAGYELSSAVLEFDLAIGDLADAPFDLAVWAYQGDGSGDTGDFSSGGQLVGQISLSAASQSYSLDVLQVIEGFLASGVQYAGFRIESVSLDLPMVTLSGASLTVDLVANYGHPVYVDSSQVIPGINFASHQIPPAVVSGYLWNDVDMNGQWDSGEIALSGWTVFVDADQDGQLGTWELTATTNANGWYEMTLLAPWTYRIAQVLPDDWAASTPLVGHYDISVASGETVGGLDFGNYQMLPATVVDAMVYRNNSQFDGYTSEGLPGDSLAIDPTKQLLAADQTPTADNITAYEQGINGIMLEIANLGDPVSLSTADFEFRVSKSGAWISAPAPVSMAVFYDVGTGGSDRIWIVWEDYSIVNCWLEITIKATANTRLEEDVILRIGNKVGDIDGDGTVNIYDLNVVLGAWGQDAAIGSPADISGDGTVGIVDLNSILGEWDTSLDLLPIAGDVNADGIVDVYDLNVILIEWGRSGGEIIDPASDINDDDVVGIFDLNIVLIDWGKGSSVDQAFAMMPEPTADLAEPAGSTYAASDEAQEQSTSQDDELVDVLQLTDLSAL